MVSTSSDIVIEIAKEASCLNPSERQLLPTKLRVKRLKKKGAVKITASTGLSTPTLKQIDKWKHLSKSKIIEV
jgi:hypothetical protein